MKRLLVSLLLAAAVTAGCAAPKPGAGPSTAASPSTQTPSTQAARAKPVVSITAADLLRRIQGGEKPLIIDVREPQEYAEGHIDGAKLMPLGTVEKAVAAAGIRKDQEFFLICRSGNRSLQAYEKLAALGYTRLVNVEGGMNAWAKVGPVKK